MKARSQYYQSEFVVARGNMPIIDKIANTLLGRDDDKYLSDMSKATDFELAADFQ